MSITGTGTLHAPRDSKIVQITAMFPVFCEIPESGASIRERTRDKRYRVFSDETRDDLDADVA